jgi:hypothetical protein
VVLRYPTTHESPVVDARQTHGGKGKSDPLLSCPEIDGFLADCH